MFFGRPFLSAGKFLAQSEAEAHMHRAFDLTFAQERINSTSHVVCGHDFLDLPCIAVRDDELCGVAESRVGWSGSRRCR